MLLSMFLIFHKLETWKMLYIRGHWHCGHCYALFDTKQHFGCALNTHLSIKVSAILQNLSTADGMAANTT